MPAPRLQLIALPGIPRVRPGDALDQAIGKALEQAGERLQSGDVLVVAQKVVSRAENRFVRLDQVRPSWRARWWAWRTAKDARLTEVVLRESKRVVRHRRGLLIVEHRLGFVSANAGVDSSNVEHEPGRPRALLLPVDPDASAARLREGLQSGGADQLGVIISDSFGRPWRKGVTGMCIGCAGVAALLDLAGVFDLDGRQLQHTQQAVADEVAAAASLLMGQAAEGFPVVLVRGLKLPASLAGARVLLRSQSEDLFR